MQNNLQNNQKFIDDARERGEDTFMYMDPKSGECLLVSGSAASIRLLGEIVDDYETVCAVVEAVDTELLERWRRECPAGCPCRKAPLALAQRIEHPESPAIRCGPTGCETSASTFGGKSPAGGKTSESASNPESINSTKSIGESEYAQ